MFFRNLLTDTLAAAGGRYATRRGMRGRNMPFVHDQTEVEYPDDGSDPAPPRADDFMYIPPPEFGGAPEPVRFSISSLDASPDTSAQQHRGILDRLLGRSSQPAAPRQSQDAYEQERQRAQRLHEQRRQQLFGILIPALRDIGARRAYCRYDGGNDEGFAWLDSVELRSGARIDAPTLLEQLHVTRVRDELFDTGVVKRSGNRSDGEQLTDLVRSWLSYEWASMLLGDSYGTGEYSMYGAFTVD